MKRSRMTEARACVRLCLAAALGLVSLQAHAGSDPLGVYAGLDSRPGRLVRVPARAVPPVATALPARWRGRALTLVQLSALALRDNPNTRAAWEKLRAQAAVLGQAKSAWWPTLDLNAPVTRSQSEGVSGVNQPPRNALKPNLSLSWLVWDFGQTSAAVAASRAQLNAAIFTQNATVQAVLSGVQQAYYQLLGDQALMRSHAEALASARTALQAAEAKHRAGQVTVADLYQARAAVAAAEATLAAGRQALASDEGTLAGAVGLPLYTRLRLAPLDTRMPPRLAESVRALMTQALQVNPTLQSTRAQVDAARAQLQAAQRTGLPSITFGATQTWTAANGQMPARQYSLGLTLSVPLFSGFKRHYQEAQASAALAEAQANLRAGAHATQLAVWQDYYAFRGAAAALPGARAQLNNARKALDAVQAQYRVGLATMQDLLSAQATVTGAQVAVTRDAINSYQALAKLSASIGTLTPPKGAMNGD